MRVKSLYSVIKKTEKLIEKNKLNSALKNIYKVSLDFIVHPVTSGLPFGSEKLDALLEIIGNKSGHQPQISKSINHNDLPIIYIASCIKNSGGHSKVLVNFINANPDKKHIIFLTQINGKSDLSFLTNSIGQNINCQFFCAPKTNFLGRLKWLQKELENFTHAKTYLFNHPEDIVAVAGVSKSENVFFYHHADHSFSLGLYIKNATHIDIHETGYQYCRHNLKIENVYLPLCIRDRESKLNKNFRINNELITCTAACSHKIEKPYFIDYLEVVPEILQCAQGKHIHIGKLSRIALFKINKELKKRKVAPERFIYLPWVESVWDTLIKYKVDLYISSFPLGGGLTLIEAMGAGVPLALHQHVYSPVLSCINLAYPDAFIWHEPEELVTFCKNITGDKLQEQSEISRKHYESFYTEKIFINFLSQEKFNPVDENALEYFKINYAEKIYLLQNQTRLKIYHSFICYVHKFLKLMRSRVY